MEPSVSTVSNMFTTTQITDITTALTPAIVAMTGSNVTNIERTLLIAVVKAVVMSVI